MTQPFIVLAAGSTTAPLEWPLAELLLETAARCGGDSAPAGQSAGRAPVPLHEDVLLVQTLRRGGFRNLSTGKLHAVTSEPARGWFPPVAPDTCDNCPAPAARAGGQST